MEKPEPIRLPPLPRPSRPLQERRKQRSDSAAEAIELALAHAAHRADLDAVLVADEEGLLVAASPCSVDLETLAAVTPLVGRGQAMAQVRRAGVPRGLTVEPVEVASELLYVAALGGKREARKREAIAGAAATRRILA